MTTLHMQTETVHTTARQMTQNAEQAALALQSLNQSVQSLQSAWQGASGDQFAMETQEILRRLNAQVDALLVLAGRVDGEVAEWEETDRSGGQSFQMTGSSLFRGVPVSIFSGGAESLALSGSAVVPLFAGLSISQFMGNLPPWLKSFLDRYFPPAEIISPVPEGPAPVPVLDTPARTPSKGFGDLLKESPQASASAATDGDSADKSKTEPAASPPNGYDIYYDIPAKSQGTLYGSAACLPTSLSMVTEYYHSKDAANQAVSPEGLKNMLDPGDGTAGVGVKLDKLNDDLGELGYKNVKNFQADMDGLKKELADGPVVANIGVKLLSSPARALGGAGATNHSVVVRGISSDGVLINDPWSGSEVKLTNEQFSAMWGKGEHWLQTVRP